MTSLLVTGAAGFIGQSVVRAARAAGYKVFTQGRRAAPGIDVVCDLRAPLHNAPPADWVVHLAGAYAGANRDELEEKDFAFARHVLAWATATGVQNIAFASAAEVYGAVAGIATEDAPTEPVIPYGRMKLRIEGLLAEFVAAAPGRTAAVLRLGEVYGVQGRLIQELSRRLRSGFCPWFGSGNVPLSFVHVDDVAQAFICAMARAKGFGIWNVADDVPATWKEFLGALSQGLEARRPPVRLPLILAHAYAAGTSLAAGLEGRPAVVTPRIVRLLTTSKPLSNTSLKQTLGFKPLYPGYGDGLKELLHGLSHDAGNGAAQRCAPA